MPQAIVRPSTITPKARESLVKYVQVVRSDTTAFDAVVLPAGAYITGVYVLGGPVSNAATTATITVGYSAGGTELLNAFDVKTNGAGYFPAGAAASASAGKQLTVDTHLWAKYAETGTASTAGGPWFVKVEYTLPGPGEVL